MLWLLFVGCPSEQKDTGGDTSVVEDDSGDTGDGSCAGGGGTVRGWIVAADGTRLESGEVRLYDETGSELLTTQPVVLNEAEGFNYTLSYGDGDYLLQAVYGDCVSDETAIELCGDEITVQDFTLDCAR